VSTKDLAYYEENPDEVTDEIMETLLTGGVIEDDTDSASADEETGEASAAGEEAKKDDEPKVVLTRDGKHTIPYEELEQSRNEAKTAKEELALVRQQIAQLEQERADLQTARDEKAAAGKDTSAEDEALKAFDEDYPTISQSVDTKIDRRLSARDAELAALKSELSELKAALQPIHEKARVSAEEAHFAAIAAAHEDAQDLIESGKLDAWVKQLPAYIRPAAISVMEKGTAQDVIDLMADYKRAHPQAGQKVSAAEKARQAVEKAKARTSVPTSLSEVPSAGVAPSEELGAYEQMSDTALMGAFMSMDQAKINDRLNRLL